MSAGPGALKTELNSAAVLAHAYLEVQQEVHQQQTYVLLKLLLEICLLYCYQDTDYLSASPA